MIWYVYVEGGGDRGALKPECRRGFSEFFRRAGISTSTFRVIACGSRDNAFRSFCTALEGGQRALLLVDSEDPVTAESAWAHLEARDRWVRPDGADEADCHLMAQCMESWFLADRDALASFFGADFNARALPGSPTAVERIPKPDVFSGLEGATRACKTKGSYGKGKHSFKILALIDPHRVRLASPFAARLLVRLG
ncbi:MAG: DUF4276 family protein [Myxococcales bacterium]|nr:DUF4276 family protein [Myxococcales bacterium]